MDINLLQEKLNDTLLLIKGELLSTDFYTQVAVLAVILVLAYGVSAWCKKPLKKFLAQRFNQFTHLPALLSSLFFPLFIIVLTAIALSLPESTLPKRWLISLAQGFAVVLILFKAIHNFVDEPFVRNLLLWVGIPLAIVTVIGIDDAIFTSLDQLSFKLGSINVSLLAIARGIIFGTVFFWLGRRSNAAGQRVIRKNESLDIATRELLVKLFEIGLYAALFIVLLQIVGINLTTLAVFGGALGVGLGFGLQQIASNFISGMIILFDRSIKVGDHVQIDDDHFGILRDIKLRYAIVETYEGKEVMIPNETFITNIFTNWSYTDDKQRYSFTFSVSYNTDLTALFPIIREAVASHPQVISGENAKKEELPDAEIDEFGDSGIVILVEFWMHGIDDGKNRVDADLKLLVWQTLKDHGFTMPLPQREVRILKD